MNSHGSRPATVLGTTSLKSDIAKWFKNRYIIAASKYAPVAQLDRAFDYEALRACRINPELIRNKSINAT